MIGALLVDNVYINKLILYLTKILNLDNACGKVNKVFIWSTFRIGDDSDILDFFFFVI